MLSKGAEFLPHLGNRFVRLVTPPSVLDTHWSSRTITGQVSRFELKESMLKYQGGQSSITVVMQINNTITNK